MSKSGRNIFVVTGPSGVGKGTVLKKVLERDDRLTFSVSATTRKPRPGEEEGVDYFFIDKEAFNKMIQEGKFLEWAQVHGNFYGTPVDFVEGKLQEGFDVILDIDVQGALQVMERRPGSIFIFIAPPDMNPEVLRARLINRNTERPGDLELRINNASEEMKFAGRFNYIVFNNVVDEAVLDIEAIIRAERLKVLKT